VIVVNATKAIWRVCFFSRSGNSFFKKPKRDEPPNKPPAFYQARRHEKRGDTFLEKLIPKNRIRRHFGENADDTASDIVGPEVCLVETNEPSVDIWEISMNLLETASRVEVCVGDQRLSASSGGRDEPAW
jgi:hypothetical protein